MCQEKFHMCIRQPAADCSTEGWFYLASDKNITHER